MHEIAGSVEGKLSLHLSRARTPSPSSIEMDSSDNPTSTISSFNMVPVVGVDHAPTTAFASEAYTPSPTISAPVSGSKQLGSASGQGLETPAHMSLATDRLLSSSDSPDAIMKVSESERNISIQDSGSGLFANTQKILITGGTFVGKAYEDPCTSKTKLQSIVCWTERCARQTSEDFY